MPKRFAMLIHAGRRTGLTRRTVLELVHDNTRDRSGCSADNQAPCHAARLLPSSADIHAPQCPRWPRPGFNPRLSGSRNRHLAHREPGDAAATDVPDVPNKTRNDGLKASPRVMG